MIHKYFFITGALALSCGSLPALDTAAPRAEVYNSQNSTTELIGTEVWNLQNEKLGRVKFITADLENARLVEVFISSGGFLGIGGKVTPAPPNALTLDPNKQILRLNVSKARFDDAPTVKRSTMAEFSQPDRVAAVIRYFGLQPWFSVDGQTAGSNAGGVHLGTVQRTDYILGLHIRSSKGQFLGQVGSLLMDLPNGRIVHVVDETQAMGDSSNYIIQPRSLRFNAAHNGLVLNENFKALKGEPHFQWIGGTRQSFEEEPDSKRKSKAGRGSSSKQTPRTALPAKPAS